MLENAGSYNGDEQEIEWEYRNNKEDSQEYLNDEIMDYYWDCYEHE